MTKDWGQIDAMKARMEEKITDLENQLSSALSLKDAALSDCQNELKRKQQYIMRFTKRVPTTGSPVGPPPSSPLPTSFPVRPLPSSPPPSLWLPDPDSQDL